MKVFRKGIANQLKNKSIIRTKISKIMFILISTFILCLTACGRKTENESCKETVLVLATFDDNAYLKERVQQYNSMQQSYRIEIQRMMRSDQAQEDGILLLQRQIASGKGPDLINFGNDYTTSDIVGAYTEDLFTYVGENVKIDYFENIVEAFSYETKLYAVPLGFTMKSFVGTKQDLGSGSSWTIKEMMDCYHGQGKEKLLYPGAFKKDVLGTILTGSMEYYMNWETGECNFDGNEFCDVLQFCNEFPDQLKITDDFSVKQIFLEDKALLLPVNVRTVYDICRVEHIFGGKEVNFIGFPVEGKSGTMIQSCGPVLAISKSSSHKDAAWAFLSWLLSPSVQNELPSGFPICRMAFEEQLNNAQKLEYKNNAEGRAERVVKQQVIFEGEDPINIYCITPKQAEQLITLVEGAEMSSQSDPKIYGIFLEEADYYFNGDKSLEDTVDVIQSKLLIYVNEKIN